MKSSKTFRPEYDVLKAVQGVFYETEREYLDLVYDSQVPPFAKALAYGHGLVETETGHSMWAADATVGPENPTNRLERLFSILESLHKRNPRELKRVLDAFAREFFGPNGPGFTLRILLPFEEDVLEPIRHLRVTLLQWWGPRYGGGETECARQILRWLQQRDSPIFDPLNEDSPEELVLNEHGYVITRRLQMLYRQALGSSDSLIDTIWEITGVNIEEALASGRIPAVRTRKAGIPAFDADLGTDAFGSYLPFHAFAFSRKSPWGIYLFLEPLLA